MWIDLCHAERGRGHIANGVPCQDKTYSLNKNGVQVIALSDGAGSAKFSHFGAEKVVEHISNYLTENFDEIYDAENNVLCEKIIDAVNDRLVALAEQLTCEIRDLACTLLLVAIKEDKYLFMHCGDGVVGIMSGDEMEVASKPMNGEFANETVFVTSRISKQCLRIEKGNLGEIRAFVLMSDGSATSFYNKKEVIFAPAVAKTINLSTYDSIESIKKDLFNAFSNFIIKKTTDDCSIAFLVKRDKQTSKYKDLSFEDKCELLLVNRTARNAKYILDKTEKLLRALQQPKTVDEILKESRLKSVKYLKSKLNKLVKSAIVTYDGNNYVSSVCL